MNGLPAMRTLDGPRFRFHHNADFSGDVIAEDWEAGISFEIPAADLKILVAAYVERSTGKNSGMNGLPIGRRAKIGDYVLATKYADGDPCDHFAVGFVSGYTHHGRYLIVDNDGRNQRANGFRRAESITADEGRQLVEMMPEIGDKEGPSLWFRLARIRVRD